MFTWVSSLRVISPFPAGQPRRPLEIWVPAAATPNEGHPVRLPRQQAPAGSCVVLCTSRFSRTWRGNLRHAMRKTDIIRKIIHCEASGIVTIPGGGWEVGGVGGPKRLFFFQQSRRRPWKRDFLAKSLLVLVHSTRINTLGGHERKKAYLRLKIRQSIGL